MNIAVIGVGTAKGSDLESFKARPEFRKATLNMILASASQDDAVSSLSLLLTKEYLNDASMILGSSYGELGTTVSFLDYYSQTGVARPLLFQNSLHNSTLGFLAMRLKLMGPSVTVSNGLRTGEDCLDLAATLLLGFQTPFCVLTAVDSVVTQLKMDGEESVGSTGEGAATLVLALKATANKMDWPVLAYLKTVSTFTGVKSTPKPDSSAYHSDAIEKLAVHILSGAHKSPLNLQKPNGSQTIIELEWA